ncbi:MAG: hypothetical protein JKX88_01325, partial [Marinicaulis sp.]|nr:hypothetical protein [Marinicaulis sp.]
MTSQFKFISKQIGASAVILSSALILSACSTISVPFSGSKVSAENAPVASDTAASEDMDKMRAQCMAMQEKMKANMAAGGSMMSDGMMSDEMKAKHKKCMGAMPEMREEMHKECMGMHKEKMGEGEMMKGD